jgi:Xaa-Pro aminopeptidase
MQEAAMDQQPARVDLASGIDMRRLRAYRLGRVREQMQRHGCSACILFNPINIRYATGTRRSAVFTLHNPARYAIITADGPVILFDYHNAGHLYRDIETVTEYRTSSSWYFFGAGPRYAEKAHAWAAEIADVLQKHGGKRGRIAVDRLDSIGTGVLAVHGFDLVNGQELLEYARAIKSAEELACVEGAMAVCETGMKRMRDALEPGLSENELWAILHHTNIALGGEWIETRLLTSGPRTNPWYQECSERVIRPGDLVAFDTDLVGPFGYLADISRTFLCGPRRPTAEQRRLYGLAYEQLCHNLALLKAGLSFREFSETSWKVPPEFVANRYLMLVHGAGMVDEYPIVPFPQDFAASGYDGVFEENMVICVESYIGEERGAEGVKLEEQVVITRTGVRNLCGFPFDEALLGRAV